jgi:hypothetical protein
MWSASLLVEVIRAAIPKKLLESSCRLQPWSSKLLPRLGSSRTSSLRGIEPGIEQVRRVRLKEPLPG